MMTPDAWRFDCAIICHHCERPIKGALIFSELLQLLDSEGFVAFNNGSWCNDCLEAAGTPGHDYDARRLP